MAKHSKPAEAVPKAQKTAPSVAAVAVEASAQVAEPAAPMASQMIRARLLSDTPAGRDLPFGLNGSWVEVTAAQFAANSDILARA
jgi:hypothetical protein